MSEWHCCIYFLEYERNVYPYYLGYLKRPRGDRVQNHDCCHLACNILKLAFAFLPAQLRERPEHLALSSCQPYKLNNLDFINPICQNARSISPGRGALGVCRNWIQAEAGRTLHAALLLPSRRVA